MRLSTEEHLKRKEKTALSFVVKKDDSGRILNPRVVSKTSQSYKKAVDVNEIVAKAKRTPGYINPNGRGVPGRFADFTKVGDFQESQNRVIKMTNEFMSLDPKIRKKFNNNPQELIQFLNDPENKEEAIKLGLLPKPVVKVEKLETPEGNFWVTTKDGKEIGRVPVKPVSPAPGA